VFGQGVRRVALLEPDEISGLPRCRLVAVTPLRPGRSSVEITSIGLGDVMLQVGRSTPVLALGTLDPHTAWLVVPGGGPEALIMNGRVVGPDQIGVYGAGAEFEVADHGGSIWSIVMLPAVSIGILLFPPRGSPMLRPGGTAVLRVASPIRQRAASLVRHVREVVTHDPAVFEVEGARMSLRSALLDAGHDLLAGAPPGKPNASARHGSAEGRRIVRAADSQLRSNPAGASDVTGLSAVLGVRHPVCRPPSSPCWAWTPIATCGCGASPWSGPRFSSDRHDGLRWSMPRRLMASGIRTCSPALTGRCSARPPRRR
jgi:hypothetical protein